MPFAGTFTTRFEYDERQTKVNKKRDIGESSTFMFILPGTNVPTLRTPSFVCVESYKYTIGRSITADVYL